jgi:hypothetical protein
MMGFAEFIIEPAEGRTVGSIHPAYWPDEARTWMSGTGHNELVVLSQPQESCVH